MSEEERKARGARARALRVALGFTSQEALSDASDGKLERVYVNRVETGANACTSGPLQRAFAETMGVSVDRFVSYLDGALSLESLLLTRDLDQAAAWSTYADIRAGQFMKDVERLPQLREYLESKEGRQRRVPEVQRVLEAYREEKPQAQSDGVPIGGWSGYFHDVLSGERNRFLRGDVEGVLDLERASAPKTFRNSIKKTR